MLARENEPLIEPRLETEEERDAVEVCFDWGPPVETRVVEAEFMVLGRSFCEEEEEEEDTTETRDFVPTPEEEGLGGGRGALRSLPSLLSLPSLPPPPALSVAVPRECWDTL